MKKKFSFGLFVISAILVLLTGCGNDENEVVKNKKSLTLDEYAANSKYQYSVPNLKCSAFNDYTIEKSLSRNLIFMSDGYVYTLVTDKESTYSNGEQCKKVDEGLKFKKVLSNYYFVGEDDTIYTYSNDLGFKEYDTYTMFPSEDSIVDMVSIYFTDEEKETYKNTQKYSGRNYIYTEYNKYVVLRNDGNLYESIYSKTYSYTKNDKTTFKLENEKVILSKNDYGFIKSFNIDKTSTGYFIYSLSTNNGLYTTKVIENEECKKYEDVACEKKLVLNDGYLMYVNQIKYIDYNIIVTNNNSLLQTSIFNISR